MDEEACHQIEVMEGLLHCFGVRIKAHKQKLHQWLAESQATHADLVKDVHELQQFTIVKLASCMTHLDSLDHEVQKYCAKVAHTSAHLAALEKHVAITKDVLVHAGLWEIRTELQGMNEKIVIVRGKWEEATIKL